MYEMGWNGQRQHTWTDISLRYRECLEVWYCAAAHQIICILHHYRQYQHTIPLNLSICPESNSYIGTVAQQNSPDPNHQDLLKVRRYLIRREVLQVGRSNPPILRRTFASFFIRRIFLHRTNGNNIVHSVPHLHLSILIFFPRSWS